MASSGVIGRHRAVPLAGQPAVAGRRPRRAWTRPLLALLAIAVLPLIGRSAVLLAGNFSPAAPSAPSPAPAVSSPAPATAADPSAAVPSVPVPAAVAPLHAAPSSAVPVPVHSRAGA